MENLKRIREPLAWALIALTVVSMLLTAAYLVSYLEWTQDEPYLFAYSGVRLISYELVLVLVVAVLGCAVPPAVPRARALAVTAAVVVSVGTAATVATLLQLGFAAVGLPELTEILGVLTDVALDLVIGVIGAVVLWTLARPARVVEADQPEEELGDVLPEAVEQAPEPPASVWGRSEASGAVWRTADEAASGAPASASFPAGPPDEDSIWRAPS